MALIRVKVNLLLFSVHVAGSNIFMCGGNESGNCTIFLNLYFFHPDEDSHTSKHVDQSHLIFKCLISNKTAHIKRTAVELDIYQHLYFLE